MAPQTEVNTEKLKKLTVAVNHGGDVHKFPYKADELVQTLIETALKHFHVVFQPHQVGLFEHGRLLDPTMTLSAAGVRAGDELVLKQTVQQGG